MMFAFIRRDMPLLQAFATTLKGVNFDCRHWQRYDECAVYDKRQAAVRARCSPRNSAPTSALLASVREAFMQKTQREINDAIIEEVLITGTAEYCCRLILKIIKGSSGGVCSGQSSAGFGSTAMMKTP